MRTLCDDVADCLNNAEVLGRILWLAKCRKGKLVLKDHQIIPRTGCSSHAEPGSGAEHIPCEALLSDEANVRGYIQVQMEDPRGAAGR